MTKKKIKSNFFSFEPSEYTSKVAQTVLVIGIGVLSIYVLGKAFKGMAVIIREFNEFRTAINGQ